jgi:hypothetical protein
MTEERKNKEKLVRIHVQLVTLRYLSQVMAEQGSRESNAPEAAQLIGSVSHNFWTFFGILAGKVHGI